MFNIFKRKIDPLKEIKAEIGILDFDNKEGVIQMIKPTVLIDSLSENIKMGGSKFGGTPDLPLHIEWPAFEGKPMVFFCQLSISELSKFDCGFTFEKPTGLLSIFHYFKSPENEYGAEYDLGPSADQYRILLTSGGEKLESKPFPENYLPEYKFQERGISFIQSYQIPGSPEHSVVINSDLSESDQAKLYEYAERNMNIFESQIGGYPLPLQDGTDLDWTAMKFPNLDYLSKEFIDEALKFENLLSFSFLHDFEVIGDSNMHIGIQKSDLEKSLFEKSALIHQST